MALKQKINEILPPHPQMNHDWGEGEQEQMSWDVLGSSFVKKQKSV